MSGFITKPEVIANEAMIVETWGRDFFVACLGAEGETFLSMLVRHGKI